jgi:chromosome segregation ATPase
VRLRTVGEAALQHCEGVQAEVQASKVAIDRLEKEKQALLVRHADLQALVTVQAATAQGDTTIESKRVEELTLQLAASSQELADAQEKISVLSQRLLEYGKMKDCNDASPLAKVAADLKVSHLEGELTRTHAKLQDVQEVARELQVDLDRERRLAADSMSWKADADTSKEKAVRDCEDKWKTKMASSQSSLVESLAQKEAELASITLECEASRTANTALESKLSEATTKNTDLHKQLHAAQGATGGGS